MSRKFSFFPDGTTPTDTDRFLIGRVDAASQSGFSNYIMTWAEIKAALGIVPVAGSSASLMLMESPDSVEDPLVIPGPPGAAGVGTPGIAGRDGNFIALEPEGPEDPLVAKGERGDRGLAGANFVMMMLQDGEQEDIVPPVPSYNNAPVSAVTTPAVPATTVAVKNNTGRDVTVYVKGGTLTAITVGGVATGIAVAAAASMAHTIPVAMNQTIAITYTVAPTWVWVGS